MVGTLLVESHGSRMIETVVTIVALLIATVQWLFGDRVALRVLAFKKNLKRVEQYPSKVLVLGRSLSGLVNFIQFFDGRKIPTTLVPRDMSTCTAEFAQGSDTLRSRLTLPDR
jgi:hypothetical protein